MSKIEGHKGLFRDDNNMAIINNDISALTRTNRLKQNYKSQRDEINTIKEEINDMKDLLLQINEKLKWQEQ